MALSSTNVSTVNPVLSAAFKQQAVELLYDCLNLVEAAGLVAPGPNAEG